MSNLSRVVHSLARDAYDARGEFQDARGTYWGLLDAEYSDYILPDRRDYATEGEFEVQVVSGSRVAKDVLQEGGTTDDAAKAVALDWGNSLPPMLHEWIVERTASRVEG